MSRLVWLLAVGSWALGCSRPPAPAPRDPSVADISLRAVTIRSYTAGQLQVVTTADSLEAFREVGTPGDLIARDAGVTLVRDGTKLHAPKVTGNFLSGQLEGSGGVSMQGAKGLTGFTEQVSFDRAAGVASSTTPVQLSQPGLELSAKRFTMELSTEHVTFEEATTRFDSLHAKSP